VLTPSVATKPESEWFWNIFGLLNDRITLFDLLQEAKKHRLCIEPAIVPEAVLIEVGLEIVPTNIVIDTADPALDKTPESLNGIRVDFASDVDSLAVVDSLMRVSASTQAIVGAEVIGKDGGLRKHVFLNESSQGIGFHVSGNESANLPFALDHANNRSLVSPAPALSFAPASVVRLIHLNLATESTNRPAFFVRQHGSNLFEHAPCRLVGDARLALNLFCGDAAPSLRHEVNSVEPNRERRRGFVEDRVGGRVNVMAAMVARIGRTALNAVMLRDRAARLTEDAVWVQIALEPFQTGRIVWELLLEVFQRVRQHFRFPIVVSHKEPAYV
jgi:hypothetical protein